MAHLLQDAYLLEDEFLQMFGLKRIEGDDLDGNHFLCVNGRVRVRLLSPR